MVEDLTRRPSSSLLEMMEDLALLPSSSYIGMSYHQLSSQSKAQN
jgi:hypothetical protein